MRLRDTPFSFAILLLRLVLAGIMIAHGWAKFHAMHQQMQFVHSLGMPGWLAYFSMAAEFGGGILLLIGLLTRLASLIILLNMLGAILKVHLPNGLLGAAGKPGYEFPLALAAIPLALALLGGGALSADWFFGGDDVSERRRAALR